MKRKVSYRLCLVLAVLGSFSSSSHSVADVSGQKLRLRFTKDATSEVSREAFRAALGSVLFLSGADKIKPLTPDEIRAYRRARISPADLLGHREKELDEKLQAIASVLGRDKSAHHLLAAAKQELLAANDAGEATGKVNAALEKALERIGRSTVSASTLAKKSALLASALRQFAPDTLLGKANQKRGHWERLSRQYDSENGRYTESWKDKSSGLVWADRLEGKFSHYDAIEVSESGDVVSEKVCTGGFRLPTLAEFEAARDNGAREVLPNMTGHWYWTASSSSVYTNAAWTFHGSHGHGDYRFRELQGSVRCVRRDSVK